MMEGNSEALGRLSVPSWPLLGRWPEGLLRTRPLVSGRAGLILSRLNGTFPGCSLSRKKGRGPRGSSGKSAPARHCGQSFCASLETSYVLLYC
jgi:hypothetical protein